MNALNVIVIKADQQRWDTLGCLGNSIVRTPNLDALGTTGNVCENAFCCTTLCVPSRTSFFTGQYVHRTGAVSNAMEHHIQADQWCFPADLAARGYRIGLVGKNHTFHDDCLDRLFDVCEEYDHWGKTHGAIRPADRELRQWLTGPGGPGPRLADGKLMEGLLDIPAPFPEEQFHTLRIAEDSIRYVDECGDQPFFLHCSFPDPHFPNVVPEPWFSMYGPAEMALEGCEIDWSGHPFAHFVQSQSSGYDSYTEAQRRRIVATYCAQVSLIDKAVGMLLDHLGGRGLLERTVIVYTSDHGDFGGRYGLIGKTKGFHEPLVRVPLLLRIPGVPAGRCRAQISNIDVMPTVWDALGLPLPEPVQGRSFLPALRGEAAAHREAIFAEVGQPEPPPPPVPLADFSAYNRLRRETDDIFWFIEYTTRGRAAMIRRDGWKYCYYTGDCDELYDLAADPLELHNLATDSALADTRERLRDELIEWLLAEPVR